jgi:hypothetical protein
MLVFVFAASATAGCSPMPDATDRQVTNEGLTAAATGANLVASPSTLAVPTGGEQSFTISNVGDATTGPIYADIVDAGPIRTFGISRENCSSESGLAPGQSCEVTVFDTGIAPFRPSFGQCFVAPVGSGTSLVSVFVIRRL